MNYKKKVFLSITLLLILVFAGCDNNNKTYSLKIDTIGEGNVVKKPNKEVYEKNDMVTLKAIPAEDHDFAFWEGAIRSTEPEPVIIMDKDKHLKANFGQKYHFEDFKDEDEIFHDNESIKAERTNEKYALTMKRANLFTRIKSFQPEPLPVDFYGEVDLEFGKTDSYTVAGFHFGELESDNIITVYNSEEKHIKGKYRLLLVNTEGKYIIKETEVYEPITEENDVKYEQYQKYNEMPIIEQGEIPGFEKDKPIKLAFSKKGDLYSFYVNGLETEQVVDSENMKPVFYLLALHTKDSREVLKEEVTVYFDNYKILSLDSK
ncbi:MAG TPA: hypothetical protein GXZ20_02045 [Halanaerobiaceae bacterium]|nr:hypothetical protein [Halanaerobiaceae bacterium]